MAGPRDQESLTEARGLLDDVARRRPGWSRVAVLQATIDERAGKPDDALADYLRAIDLGDRQVPVARRAIMLLLERRRYADADQVIRKLNRE